MFWCKKLRQPKDNMCFGAKSLEENTCVGAKSLENNGKTHVWAQKAQKTTGKHLFLHKKLAIMLAIAKLATAMIATAKLAKSKLAKSKACKSKACKTSAYKSKASHNNKARKTLFGVLAPVSFLFVLLPTKANFYGALKKVNYLALPKGC